MKFQELTWRERGRLWLRILIRLIFAIGILVLLFQVGKPLAALCMPFLVALVFTWLLEPLIRFLMEHTILRRKSISVVLILLFCGAVGGGLVWFFYQVGEEIVSLSQNWESIWNGILAVVNQLNQLTAQFLDYLPPDIQEFALEVSDRMFTWLKSIGTSLIPRTTSFAMGVPSVVVGIVFSLLGTYFISSDYPMIRSTVTDKLPPNVREFSSLFKKTFNAAFGGYIKAQLFLSLAVFIILVIGLSFMRLPYAILIALGFAIVDFIPIIGSGTFMIPWAIIDCVLGNWSDGLALLMIWGVIALFRRIAEPRVVGTQTGLHPVLALLSIYVGMRSFGVLGMVFAPVFLLVVINLIGSGIFHRVNTDIVLAARDIGAFLKNEK